MIILLIPSVYAVVAYTQQLLKKMTKRHEPPHQDGATLFMKIWTIPSTKPLSLLNSKNLY